MVYSMEKWKNYEKSDRSFNMEPKESLYENIESIDNYEDCLLQEGEEKYQYSEIEDDYEDCLKSEEVKVLKRDEVELLGAGNRAINQRIEAKEDDYRDKGLSETEIQERLEVDKRNFQNEFLEDAFPKQEVSPEIFNGFVKEIESKTEIVDNIDDNLVEADNIIECKEVDIEGAFENVPFERQEAVYDRFKDAPVEIKNIINDLSEKLSVEYAEKDDSCHYDGYDMVIRMEENMDDAEYSELFTHEYGHFVDQMKGDISNTDEFRKSLNYDLEKYNRYNKEGKKKFQEMINELMGSDAAYDRAISDNMSAFFINDPEIVQKYEDEGILYYRHSNEYWKHSGNREAEIYANSFSMLSQNNRKSWEFMETYFPNTWDYVKKTLKGD